MDIVKVLALVRRYADAIASGRLKAKQVKGMSDAELAQFDDELFAELNAKQKEAEDLVKAHSDAPEPQK